MDDLNELTKTVDKILNYCIEECPNYPDETTFTKQQLVVLVVYRIVLEMAEDALIMIKKKNCFSSVTLLRGLFEYQIELLYQAKDDKNLSERYKDAQRDQLSHLNAIIKSKASKHKKWTKQQWFKTVVNKLKSALGSYKKNRFEDLCIKLGLQHDYDSHYRPLVGTPYN